MVHSIAAHATGEFHKVRVDGDKGWRWIVRISGLLGIFYGALLAPSLPESYLIIFAAMVGLPEFIKSKE